MSHRQIFRAALPSPVHASLTPTSVLDEEEVTAPSRHVRSDTHEDLRKAGELGLVLSRMLDESHLHIDELNAECDRLRLAAEASSKELVSARQKSLETLQLVEDLQRDNLRLSDDCNSIELERSRLAIKLRDAEALVSWYEAQLSDLKSQYDIVMSRLDDTQTQLTAAARERESMEEKYQRALSSGILSPVGSDLSRVASGDLHVPGDSKQAGLQAQLARMQKENLQLRREINDVKEQNGALHRALATKEEDVSTVKGNFERHLSACKERDEILESLRRDGYLRQDDGEDEDCGTASDGSGGRGRGVSGRATHSKVGPNNMFSEMTMKNFQLAMQQDKLRMEALDNEVRTLREQNKFLLTQLGDSRRKGKLKSQTLKVHTVRPRIEAKEVTPLKSLRPTDHRRCESTPAGVEDAILEEPAGLSVSPPSLIAKPSEGHEPLTPDMPPPPAANVETSVTSEQKPELCVVDAKPPSASLEAVTLDGITVIPVETTEPRIGTTPELSPQPGFTTHTMPPLPRPGSSASLSGVSSVGQPPQTMPIVSALTSVMSWARNSMGISLSELAQPLASSAGKSTGKLIGETVTECNRLIAELDVAIKRLTNESAYFDELFLATVDVLDDDSVMDDVAASPLLRLKMYIVALSSIMQLALSITPKMTLYSLKRYMCQSGSSEGDSGPSVPVTATPSRRTLSPRSYSSSELEMSEKLSQSLAVSTPGSDLSNYSPISDASRTPQQNPPDAGLTDTVVRRPKRGSMPTLTAGETGVARGRRVLVSVADSTPVTRPPTGGTDGRARSTDYKPPLDTVASNRPLGRTPGTALHTTGKSRRSFPDSVAVPEDVARASPLEVEERFVSFLTSALSHCSSRWRTVLSTVTHLAVCNKPFASKWVPDESRQTCAACATEFTSFTRRHHCRACGDVFCSKCSNLSVDFDACKMLPSVVRSSESSKDNHRVCYECSVILGLIPSPAK